MEKIKKKILKEELIEIEGVLEDIYYQTRDGILSILDRKKVVDLESRKLNILKKEE